MAETERIADGYEVTHELGRGGMGTVYRAVSANLGRVVALKVLRGFDAGDPAVAGRIAREARLVAGLEHPNVVTIYEYFDVDGVPYIAMEWAEWGSLRRYIGSLSLAQIFGVLEGVLAGLAHASERGVVHRDVKPENVLVTSSGSVKLADFGIATAAGEVGNERTVAVGTPAYMAPEQASGGPVSPAADLYSVGVMAYEMLVGNLQIRHPRTAPLTPVEPVDSQRPARLPPSRAANPLLDKEVAAWIDRMLDADPISRYEGARDAWRALEAIVVRLLGAEWRRDAALDEPPRRPEYEVRHESVVGEPRGTRGDTGPLARERSPGGSEAGLSAWDFPDTLPPPELSGDRQREAAPSDLSEGASSDLSALLHRGSREFPPSARLLMSLCALAVAGAVVAGIGLMNSSEDDPLPWGYITGLLAAAITLGILAYAAEGRRQMIARAKANAYRLAYLWHMSTPPLMLDATELDDAMADLVLLENAGENESSDLLGAVLGVARPGDRTNSPLTGAMPTISASS